MNTKPYLVFFGDNASINVPAITQILSQYQPTECPRGHWFFRANITQHDLYSRLQQAAGSQTDLFVIGVDPQSTWIKGAGDQIQEVSRVVQTMRAA